jgi:hypothetical protein
MHPQFAIENATFVLCRSCQRPIDIWSPPDFKLVPTSAGRGRLTPADPANAVCPDCLVERLPEPEREREARRYENARLTAQAAGIPVWATTYLWHSLGDPKIAWTRGYGIVGYAVRVRDWDPTWTNRPWFSLTPDDSNEPALTFVWFAAEIGHSDVRGAHLRCLWPFHDLTLPPTMEIVDGLEPAVTERNLINLVRGRRFLQEVAGLAPGRPTGSTDRDCEWYRSRAEEFLRQHGRVPREHEFLRFARVARTTMRENLKACGLWPWKQFVRDAFPLTSIRR